MDGYRDATSDFVQSTKGVIGAVDMLRTAIASGDPDDIDFATDIVARAADSYAGNTAKYERFGLDEIAATPDKALPNRERVASDLLASALLDLEVANTLIVAGRAAEKTDQPVPLTDLDAAVGHLNSLTNVVAFPLGKDVGIPAPTARFGFDEVPSAEPTAPSPDLATAKANFEKRVTEFLLTLVDESKKVVQAAFTGVEGLDQQRMVEAIGVVGKTALELPRIGKLISKGLALAVQAMQKITKLLGSAKIEALQEEAKRLVGRIQESGTLLDKFLENTYGLAVAKERVRALLEKTSAQIATIDAGAKRLAELRTRFAEQMALVSRIVGALGTGKRIAGIFLPEVTTVLLFGGFYLLAMSYAVLAGMDFADRVGLLNLVDGVVKTSESILT